jgi:kinesin family member C2/C3
LHLLGSLTENNSSGSVEDCNGLQKQMGLGVCTNKIVVCDTTQLPTYFYQRYSPVRQSCGTESVRSMDSHNFGPAATRCSDQVAVSSIGLKVSGVTNRGASTIKKPEVTPTR